MSTFENDQYRWRETYFVLFFADKRPLLGTVEKHLASLSKRYQLSNQSGDEDGRFESLTVVSPDDFAALDICYTSGPEVLEQGEELVDELAAAAEPPSRDLLRRLKQYDGRFDVLHFEQVAEASPEDDEDELLDPSALLAVLEALAKITGGVAVDPSSGTILGDEG
ncbi:MAG: hypothetical protein ABR915_14105 [Thermoguttaceae bacterium]|jgi:hypothetical protein